MLAEVRLIIASKEARLILKKGEKVIEDELWKFDARINRSEAGGLADAAFHDAFDLIQYAVYDDDDSGRAN
jgi:hypothetical protein